MGLWRAVERLGGSHGSEPGRATHLRSGTSLHCPPGQPAGESQAGGPLRWLRVGPTGPGTRQEACNSVVPGAPGRMAAVRCAGCPAGDPGAGRCRRVSLRERYDAPGMASAAAAAGGDSEIEPAALRLFRIARRFRRHRDRLSGGGVAAGVGTAKRPLHVLGFERIPRRRTIGRKFAMPSSGRTVRRRRFWSISTARPAGWSSKPAVTASMRNLVASSSTQTSVPPFEFRRNHDQPRAMDCDGGLDGLRSALSGLYAYLAAAGRL